MLEVEIKSPCADPDAMRIMLSALGTGQTEARVDRDRYFNHPSRDFAETDEAVRIRSIGDRHYLTYKGPKLSAKTKSRVEEEVSIADAETGRKILTALSFTEVLLVEKKREVYKLNEIEICLDTIEGLGSFVELEIMTDDQQKGEEKLFALAGQLGLKEFVNISLKSRSSLNNCFFIRSYKFLFEAEIILLFICMFSLDPNLLISLV